MRFPLTMRCTDNFSCSLINYYLRLKRMPFLFAAKEAFLFFLGLSIGLSITSITIASTEVFNS